MNLVSLAAELRERVRSAHGAVVRRLGDRDPYQIVAYRGYGTAKRVLLIGRVLEDEGVAPAAEADTTWRNIVNTYKRLESDPVPFARVRARVGGIAHEMAADDEGFFRRWASGGGDFADGTIWHPVTFELVAPLRDVAGAVRATGFVLTPSRSATFGVITDLDDTVMQSRVSNFLEAARKVILGNARTRLPFPGVAAFYQALHGGAGAAQNPIFYVSSSPWNLYDVITHFLEIQGIPLGPVLLRDWDIGRRLLSAEGHQAHKATHIREIFATYPTLPFILIGDSTQEDPEIYCAVVRDWPRRVLAVYIRSVSPHPERIAAIRRLAAEVERAGSALVLADDTLTAARHAAAHGWIAPESLPAVAEEKRADEGTAAGKVDAPGVGPATGGATVVVE